MDIEDFLQPRWIQVFVILIIVVAALGNAFRKIFLSLPEELKKAQRKLDQGLPPVQPGQGGRDQAFDRLFGRKSDVDEFFEALRREADKEEKGIAEEQLARSQDFPAPGAEPVQARQAALEERRWEDLKWEVLEPEAPPSKPATGKAQEPGSEPPPAPGKPRALAPAAKPPVLRDAELAGGYFIDTSSTSGEQPGWLSLSDLTRTGGVDKLLGASLAKAMLLKEVLGPPKALRNRRPRRIF
ncbi:MAG: hypothetical protein HY717_17300 [Planctomycetes bacterium]|nr:hypothetical protein [Planctomycetota bacterium]